MTEPAATKQSVASVVRQILAVLASAAGVITASVGQLHLPPAISATLTATGPVILAIEHFVADPSTGTASAVVQAVSAEPDAAKVEAQVRAAITRILGLDTAAPVTSGLAGPVTEPVTITSVTTAP